jgi:hypothetical protein
MKMKDVEEILKELGYHWEVTSDDYRVFYKDDFIGGAGVKLPRSKPLHWKHAKQNRIDFRECAISVAKSHAISTGIFDTVSK